jgi:hypothetical protein
MQSRRTALGLAVTRRRLSLARPTKAQALCETAVQNAEMLMYIYKSPHSEVDNETPIMLEIIPSLRLLQLESAICKM